MLLSLRVLGATTAVYIATVELYVLGEKLVPHPEGGCTDAPGDYTAAAVACLMLALFASSAWVARSSGRRWVLPTAFHAAVPAGLATLVGVPYYGFRLARAATCSEMSLCTWCMPHWDEIWWVQVVMAAGVATLLGLAAGAVARRITRAAAGS